jgi:hypothetical protein
MGGIKMLRLKDVMDNNLLLAFAGANFTNSAFRRLTAQYPYEVTIYTIYNMDDKKKDRKFRRLLNQSEDPFIVIIRDENARLEDVLFVPSKEKRESSEKKEIELATP